MRIRRRPSVPPPVDPAPQICTQNGSRGSSCGGGGAAAAPGEGLHPVGDLPPMESGKIFLSSSLSDPLLLAPPFPASPELPQASKEEEEDDAGETEVDSNRRCSNRINGSSSAAAAAPSWEMIASPAHGRVGVGEDSGSRDGGGAEAKPATTEGERKEKMKARASSSSGGLNCTGEGGDRKEGQDGGSGKRRRSPAAAVLMEGSRCSRVNGRGWRCCQQTLVGYSLCEHHLGKGRLRSVTSVRGQLGTSKSRWVIDESNGVVPSTSPEKKKPPPPPVYTAGIKGANQLLAEEDDEEEEEEEDEETARKTSTRRKKVGAVKARSISSLLDDFEVSSAAAAPPREELMN